MKQTCGQKVDSLNSQCPPTSVPQQDVLERDSLAPPLAAVDREVWGRKLLNTTNAIILLLNPTFKSVNQACHDNYTVDVSVYLRDFDFFVFADLDIARCVLVVFANILADVMPENLAGFSPPSQDCSSWEQLVWHLIYWFGCKVYLT